MKSFFMPRRTGFTEEQKSESVLVVEFGFWDMVRLLLGREIATHSTVIRAQPAYDAFNLAAAPMADSLRVGDEVCLTADVGEPWRGSIRFIDHERGIASVHWADGMYPVDCHIDSLTKFYGEPIKWRG